MAAVKQCAIVAENLATVVEQHQNKKRRAQLRYHCGVNERINTI